MNRKRLRQAHRWLGLLFSLTILMSSGSGVLHTVMTRTQAPPPSARPSGGGLDASAIRIAPSEAPSKLPAGTGITALNLRTIQSQPCYQIFTAQGGDPLYLSAVDGTLDPNLDETYAREIASRFLGGKDVKRTDYLRSFNSEYLNIFRILPVYRFDADDGQGSRVYVSTTTGSVTRYTNNRIQFEASAFTNFHKLGFIANKDLRDWTLGLITAGAFLVSLLGIALFFFTAPRKAKS